MTELTEMFSNLLRCDREYEVRDFVASDLADGHVSFAGEFVSRDSNRNRSRTNCRFLYELPAWFHDWDLLNACARVKLQQGVEQIYVKFRAYP
jgi:hypothetical protein